MEKFDAGKTEWSLLSYKDIEPMVRVMMHGAKKYGRNNWKLDTDPQRCLNALLRHVMAHSDGEYTDPESGLPHMAHVMCNAMFILHAMNIGDTTARDVTKEHIIKEHTIKEHTVLGGLMND